MVTSLQRSDMTMAVDAVPRECRRGRAFKTGQSHMRPCNSKCAQARINTLNPCSLRDFQAALHAVAEPALETPLGIVRPNNAI